MSNSLTQSPREVKSNSALLAPVTYCECCDQPMDPEVATLVERGMLLVWYCPDCLMIPPAVLPDDVTCRLAAGLVQAALTFTDVDRREWMLEVAEGFLDGSLIVEVR